MQVTSEALASLREPGMNWTREHAAVSTQQGTRIGEHARGGGSSRRAEARASREAWEHKRGRCHAGGPDRRAQPNLRPVTAEGTCRIGRTGRTGRVGHVTCSYLLCGASPRPLPRLTVSTWPPYT